MNQVSRVLSLGLATGAKQLRNLSFVHNLEKRRVPEKHRLMVRTNYRLEAYATFTLSPRRDGFEVMVLPHDLELSLDARKSNLA
jgi:hypothetical protein